MKPITNQAMLITYADSLGGNLRELERILSELLPGVVGSVHLLPFYPSSGDHGFAVIGYDRVDEAFGTWDDVARLASRYGLAVDFMVNHVSAQSREFTDYLEHGDKSPYAGMFIRWEEFWPDGEPDEAQSRALFRRKPHEPWLAVTRKDGRTVRVWNTFSEQQIDVDPFAESTKAYYRRNLARLAQYAPMIRLDAVAYASKRPGTSCFFVEPEIWRVLDICQECAGPDVQFLAEIHSHYRYQQKMAQHGVWVYDFALPALMLHALFTGETPYLRRWLSTCPRKQFTTLDTHDGIGLIDVEELLPEEEIARVQQIVNRRVSASLDDSRLQGVSVTTPGTKTRQYQLMGTYFSALGADEDAYRLARAVQLYAPGTPQIYYAGLLAAENSTDAMQGQTDARELNRPRYTREGVRQALQRPVVQDLCALLRFRNLYPAFDGDFALLPEREPGVLELRWKKDVWETTLRADFRSRHFTLRYAGAKGAVTVADNELAALQERKENHGSFCSLSGVQ